MSNIDVSQADINNLFGLEDLTDSAAEMCSGGAESGASSIRIEDGFLITVATSETTDSDGNVIGEASSISREPISTEHSGYFC